MNELYGIDPAAPATAEDLISLIRMFGPTEGRFIAEYPADWLNEIRTFLSLQPDVKRARALEWLKRRRHALLFAGHYRSVPGRTWAEGASSLLREGVAGLIGSRGCAANLMPIDQVLFDAGALPDARGSHISRTSAEYVKASWPILSLSPRVVLVDPYLRLRLDDGRTVAKRQRKVLVDFLIESVRRRKVEVFSVCVTKSQALAGDLDGKRLKADLVDAQEEAGASGIEVAFHVLHEDAGKKQHARYLLGVGCGMQFDYGFDAPNDNSLNHVHWLSESELAPLLRQFGLPSS